MSEQPRDVPAPLSPVSRFIGVISSPRETFEDIDRRPAWLPPLIIYFVVFAIAFGFYSSKADWVAIITEQVQANPLLKMLPEQQQDQAVQQSTDSIRKLSSSQIATQGILQAALVTLVLVHSMAVIFASLFVLMGSLKTLRVGRMWLNLFLCLLLFVPYLITYAVTTLAFREEPGNAVMINAAATVVVVFAWGWLLNRFARSEGEFLKMLSVFSHGAAIATIGALALLATSLVTPAPIVTPAETIVKANLGALVSTGMPALQKLLEWLNLFTIWALVVVAIGHRVVTRLTMGVAASLTFLPWAFVMLISVAIAAVFG